MSEALPRAPNGRPTFYVRRGDRLIARLKHILYACRFARQVNGQVIALWPELSARSKLFDGDNYTPWLIFDRDRFHETGVSDWLAFVVSNAALPSDVPRLAGPEFASFRNNRFLRETFAADGLAFADGTLLNYHFRGDDSRPAQVATELRAIFASIPLHPELIQRLARFQEEIGGGYTCVHFRAGDVYLVNRDELPVLEHGTLSPERLTSLMGHFVVRTAPVELYASFIERALAAGERIVFTSDSPEYFDRFTKAFGAEHFVNLAAHTAPHPIQKAMLDFLVLAGSRRILGTRSNYASLAAALGGGEHVTVSAANAHGMTPEFTIDLYMTTALRDLLPGRTLPAAAKAMLHEEIRRRYLFVNRIGTKEEVNAMDPRNPVRVASGSL